MNWHNLSTQDTLKNLNVLQKEGLNSKQVKERLEKYGKNRLTQKKKKSILKKFLEQFSDFMVIILLIASVVSFATSIFEHNSDYIDSIIILIIVIINAIIGVIQESKAEKAIDALKKLSSPKARVIRNSEEKYIDSENVVPGDIILFETGDLVCADVRIIKAYNLKVSEASLTGESLPVNKSENVILNKNTHLADMKNMLFSSSTIISGHAFGIVVATGMNSQVGKIAHMINEEDSPETPLQKKLAQTGKYLGIGALAICFVIFILGIIQNVPFLEMFMISISLAVAAIPEGLPAVVTIVLAIGVKRMAINRAIIRKLPAVETLGSATVICSDKTGTLTQNKMTVTKLSSYNNEIKQNSREGLELLSFAALCNNSTLKKGPTNFDAIGEPTENALIIAAAKMGKLKTSLEQMFPRVGEIPFDSTKKCMTTIHKLSEGHYRVITKGALDVILNYCKSVKTESGIKPIDFTVLKSIEQKNEQMAKDALRVLAVAFCDIDTLYTTPKELNKNLCFCGLIGMIDPPRPEAKYAVTRCKNAGIKPVMITGDHIITAKAIAKKLGILTEGSIAITGQELEKISDEELEKNISNYSVFARVSPEHKVKIVKAFQKNGDVVAMTGDGVNDAPALKSADIGCAMGITGTDVAKGAADMIMTDDNFSTIVEAVRQGRSIFQNIKRTVHFLLSSNIGEIITVLVAFLLRLPSPLLAIQLLWVNLVTDSFPALALGVEPVDEDIMKEKPISSKKNMFDNNMWYIIAIEGLFIGAISLLAFTIGKVFFDSTTTPVIGRTMAFCVLSICQLVHAFNVRSDKSILKTGICGNLKLLYSFVICLILQVSVVSIESISKIFKTHALTFAQWFIVIILSLSPLLLVEIEKYIAKNKNKNYRTNYQKTINIVTKL